MLLNHRHLPWAIFVLAATAVAWALYAKTYHNAEIPIDLRVPAGLTERSTARAGTYGATPLGLLYGSISLGIFLFAAALGIRKKRRLWPIGNVRAWLRAHIWLSVLTIPLILFHAGFKLGGPMTATLMILYGIVMGSGFLGLALQQFLPRMMTASLPREVIYEQIPHVRAMLVEKAEQLQEKFAPATAKLVRVASAGHEVEEDEESDHDIESRQAMIEFLREDALPYLRAESVGIGGLATQKGSDDHFRIFRMRLGGSFYADLDALQQWCDDRRTMDRQVRLHHWMHAWLLVHVPLSFALIVLTIWHAYITIVFLT